MIKTINTGIAELLCVKVPDIKLEYKVFGDFLVMGIDHPDMVSKCNKISRGDNRGFVQLPKGTWTLLGIAHDLTEEVWYDMLPNCHFAFIDFTKDGMDGFNGNDICLNSATESGLSLLREHEVYDVNPYGATEPELDSVCCNRWVASYSNPNIPECCNSPVPSDESRQLLDMWQESQQSIGKWVMLRKIEE